LLAVPTAPDKRRRTLQGGVALPSEVSGAV